MLKSHLIFILRRVENWESFFLSTTSTLSIARRHYYTKLFMDEKGNEFCMGFLMFFFILAVPSQSSPTNNSAFIYTTNQPW